MDKWIDFSDQPPKKGQFICAIRKGWPAFSFTGHWDDKAEYNRCPSLTHYIVLPEPPKYEDT